MKFDNSLEFAQQRDNEDSLREFRDKFFFPINEGKELIYLNGNSLGLQPKTAIEHITQELEDWAQLGGHGHFIARNPWVSYHKQFKPALAKLVGAHPEEVVAMNSLTVNLHLLLVSFYRPTKERYKIIIEKGAFSSDLYAVESQVRFHGFDPENDIIEIGPSDGDYYLTTSEIIQTIEKNKDNLALILFGGVNFYTGQAFNLKAITEAGQRAGAIVGFDLAHAIGNIKLDLHDWNVDFAVWCSYKYLNSGPGGVGGAFINNKYAKDKTLPRFAGWWGHLDEERFRMEKGFKPMDGADGWQLSNAPVISMAVHKASLDVFEEAGIENLTAKSHLLTGYLEYLLNEISQQLPYFKIITPSSQEDRGCQLSILFKSNAEDVYSKLIESGVVVDMRRPNVIRVTPVPLYNSFTDVYNFSVIFKEIIKAVIKQ